nr:two-component sensor kinase [Chroomonas debatzensis]
MVISLKKLNIKYVDKVKCSKTYTKSTVNLIHELKNPLFNIRSFLETLYEYYFQLDDNQILEFLEVTNQEINRLTRLVTNTLDDFKLNSELFCFPKKVILENLVLFCIKSYRFSALRKQVSLYFKIHTSVRQRIVEGNSDLISQVLNNLISNSLKFTYPSGLILLKVKKVSSLKIRSRIKKEKVRLDLIDTGIGISKKNMIKILYTSKSIQGTPYFLDGTGLGFPIVKEILLKSNSLAYLISGLKKGTCIFFNLRLLNK